MSQSESSSYDKQQDSDTEEYNVPDQSRRLLRQKPQINYNESGENVNERILENRRQTRAQKNKNVTQLIQDELNQQDNEGDFDDEDDFEAEEAEGDNRERVRALQIKKQLIKKAPIAGIGFGVGAASEIQDGEENKGQMDELQDAGQMQDEDALLLQDGGEDLYTQEPGGIFFPEIDQILWRKNEAPPDSSQPLYRYLIKYKDYSYLHCEWLDEKEVVADSKSGRNKLNRFNKMYEKKLREGEFDTEMIDNERYFDPSYCEVDRIIHTTELFPVIHPKKANEIKGKWTEMPMLVVSKLLNFTKDDVHYGIFFMEPVNPERDGCPTYKKMIHYPMDFGTLLNRVYLDFYKNAQQFWNDLGFVFKNCRKFNKDPESDIRILCDTLREAAIFLYKQWHAMMSDRYKKLLDEHSERTNPVYREEKEKQHKLEIQMQSEKEFKTKENEITVLLQQFEKYQIEANSGSQEKVTDFRSMIKDFLSNNNNEQLLNCSNKFENLIKGGLDSGAVLDQAQFMEKLKKNIQEEFRIEQRTVSADVGDKYNSVSNSSNSSLTNSEDEQVKKSKRGRKKKKVATATGDSSQPQPETEHIEQQKVEQYDDEHPNQSKVEQLKVEMEQLKVEQSLVEQTKVEQPKVEEIEGEQVVQPKVEQIEQPKLESNVKEEQMEEEKAVVPPLEGLPMQPLNNNNAPLLQPKELVISKPAISTSNQNIQQPTPVQQSVVPLTQMSQPFLPSSTLPLSLQKKTGRAQSMSPEEIEKFNPGPYNFEWLIDDNAAERVEDEQTYYVHEAQEQQLDLNKEPDRLYLVKWKNLSYLDSTWEHETVICCPNKVSDYRQFNRALDKESRAIMMAQNNRHKTLLDLENNPKKKQKLGYSQINDIKNKLYFYDIANKKQPCQYTMKTQPIYKDRKLLRDYQLESLNWMIQAWYSKRNVILADEMGLGKTIQSIAFLNHLYSFENCRGPFLVIAPLGTLEHWKRTVEDWTNLNGVLYYDSNSQDGRACCRYYEWLYTDISTKGTVLQTSEIYKFQIIITSNEVFMQDVNTVLVNVPFQFIVVDEAHRLKNQNAKILAALKRMPCKRILLLTGTPIQNNTEELWTLLNYIEPNKFSQLSDFKKEFADLKNQDQVDKLQKVLKPFLLRRMKDDVEASIPPLQETIIDIEMTNIQKTLYRAIYERNKSMLQKNFSTLATTTSLNNLEMQLRKCCNHPFLIREIETELCMFVKTEDERYKKLIETSGKMILLDKLIQKFRMEQKKVLVFSQFTYILQLLEEYLRHENCKYEKIDGSIKSKERQNAIDRFNCPEKHREVFLLSTKAGGLGINLTSANVVIIFDSDWNPQNDVQATARAHRIGQKFEVQVYRFITKKTYEAEMFERATKKLGLDQAIFLGGDFKNTQNQLQQQGAIDPAVQLQAAQQQNANGKLMKNEIEMLLKKGILGLMNDEDEKDTTAFFEENIDEILKKNTRVAKYSLINGTYSFSKSSFVSSKTEPLITLDDPNFWEKVLKDQESKSLLLRKQLETSQREITSRVEEQKVFIYKVSEFVNNIIESKLSLTGYNADDEKNISDILNIVATCKGFNQKYKTLATQWIYEIARPSRRFKRFTLQELDVMFDPQLLGSTQVNQPRGNNNISDDQEAIFEEDSDELDKGQGNLDQLYSDGGGGGEQQQKGNNTGGNNQASGAQSSLLQDPRLKISQKTGEDLLKKLCYYCERPKCTHFCKGFCKRAFHQACTARVDAGWVNKHGPDLNDPIQPNEVHLDEERIKKLINLNYTCKDCSNCQAICFICKKKGAYYGTEQRVRNKKKPTSNAAASTGNGEEPQANKKADQLDEELINNEAEVVVIDEDDNEVQIDEEPNKQEKEKGLQNQPLTNSSKKPSEKEKEDDNDLIDVDTEVENKEEIVGEGEVEEPDGNKKDELAMVASQSGKKKNDLTKCSTANCNKFYHLNCITGHKLFKFIDANHRRFRCSLHYCNKCSISGDSMAIAQCIRCHRAYHLRCYDKEKTIKLAKKIIICQDHKQANHPSMLQTHGQSKRGGGGQKEINTTQQQQQIQQPAQNQQSQQQQQQSQQKEQTEKREFNIFDEEVYDGKINKKQDLIAKKGSKPSTSPDNNTIVKLQKISDDQFNLTPNGNAQRITRSQDGSKYEQHSSSHQQKLDRYFGGGSSNKKGQKIIDKERRSGSGGEQNERNSEDIEDELDEDEKNNAINANNSEIEEEDEEIGIEQTKQKKKKKGKGHRPAPNFHKQREVPLISYAEFCIQTPSEFDYENYQQDWCRYCGARFSSNFTKGPWGPRTLCTVHYIAWNQKKKLNLSAYKEKPKKPINPTDLTELTFISKLKIKSPEFDAAQQLREMQDPSNLKLKKAGVI